MPRVSFGGSRCAVVTVSPFGLAAAAQKHSTGATTDKIVSGYDKTHYQKLYQTYVTIFYLSATLVLSLSKY